MAKGLIPIKAAEDMAEEYGAPVIVIFAIHPDRENFTVTTYGHTKKLCRLAATYGEELAKAVLKTAEIVQIERQELPEAPAIWEARHGKA